MAMSGPEHYHEAERLLDKVNRNKNAPDNATRLQRAQVHATLALIAATIQAGDVAGNKLADWQRRGLKP
jgi:hypothetical protein